MPDKYFTFLYIPVNNAEPRTMRVRRSSVYVLGAALVCLLIVASAFGIKYSGKVALGYHLAQLEQENAELKDQLVQVDSDVDALRRQVMQNFDFQRKARLLANLDEIGDDVTEVGVGGPDYGRIRAISHLDPESRERILETHADIDKLLRQAELQRASYTDIINSLETTDEKLRTTPSLYPVNVGFVSSNFGRRMDPLTGRRTMHRGIDFSARLGTPVFATADGVVTFSGTWKTYGHVVEVSHGHGIVTRFAHLQKRLVRKGQKVRRGDLIARVGASGKSTFSHLHYEVERDGNRVDPRKYLIAR